jgi:RNA polymerase sigma-70 factor (ECF subfamily)
MHEPSAELRPNSPTSEMPPASTSTPAETPDTNIEPAAYLVDFDARLNAARAGSREALGEILQSLRSYLLMAAGKWLRSDVLSQQNLSDLVQSAQMEAIRDFPGFRGETQIEFQSWLSQILRHNLLNVRRAAQRSLNRDRLDLAAWGALIGESAAMHGNDPTPSSIVARTERDRLLHDGLKHLPDRYRQVILLHNFQKQTFAEIGRQWGSSAEAVRKTWSRALQQLEGKMRPLL